VKILKAELPWTLLAVGWLPAGEALRTREALQDLMAVFPFASCVPFSNNAPLDQAASRERTGVLFRAAAHEAPPDSLLERMESLLGLTGADTLRYADRRKGQRRSVRVLRDAGEMRLQAVLLAGDTSAEAWLKALLVQELPAQAYGRLLLAPGAKAPVALQAAGKQVCSCFGVEEGAIASQLVNCNGSPEERLAALQGALKCGTNCGSCVPELKRLVRSVVPLQQAA
jgi:assimilatory nitrate reductase catalytic subunit